MTNQVYHYACYVHIHTYFIFLYIYLCTYCPLFYNEPLKYVHCYLEIYTKLQRKESFKIWLEKKSDHSNISSKTFKIMFEVFTNILVCH